MADRVVFLDIDGTLTSYAEDRLKKSPNPESVALVQQLCRKTQAKIVVSSSLRALPENGLGEVLTSLGFGSEFLGNYLHNDPATPVLNGAGRAQEIQTWLAKHPETILAVAIDDMYLDLPFAVQCDPSHGFTKTDFGKALKTLMPNKPGVVAALTAAPL